MEKKGGEGLGPLEPKGVRFRRREAGDVGTADGHDERGEVGGEVGRVGQDREGSGEQAADDLDDEEREAEETGRLELPDHFLTAFPVGGGLAFLRG